MTAQAEFRQALMAGDVDLCARIAAETNPHLPRVSRADAEIQMHHARTLMASLPLRYRAYSHAWLSERGLPTGLPESLKPAAERLYPRKVKGVMIGIKGEATSPFRPALIQIRQAMEGAVLEAEADGRLDDDAHVKARMAEARARKHKLLFGTALSVLR